MTNIIFLLERVKTPLGQMLIATDEQQRLRVLDWQDQEGNMHALIKRQYPGGSVMLRETAHSSSATAAIEEYFAGNIPAIDTITTATGGTDFQRAVWKALRDIPHGQTISYGTLAQRIGRPTAIRAVGMANGANPISIVVPCHRVIGANHSLTGYGGGLHRKQWLLAHEGCRLAVNSL